MVGVEKNILLSSEDQKVFDREVIRLELTLQSAQKLLQEGDKLICMMHYPPVSFAKEDSEFSALLEKYNVDKVVYGHLHGYKNVETNFIKNGIEYYLTSCDEVYNSLTLISEV